MYHVIGDIARSGKQIVCSKRECVASFVVIVMLLQNTQ